MNHWQDIRQTLPTEVQLVAVSKYHTAEQTGEVYAEGCRDFGESRVQELRNKQEILPKDIRWHFIGHLQTNKVRDLLRLRPYLIHSVDSLHLLRAIDTEASKQGIVQDVLLELHVAREQSKSGFTPEEYEDVLHAISSQGIVSRNVRIRGVMAMATNTDDEQEIRRCFRNARALFERMTSTLTTGDTHMVLSMGMSDDYLIAIDEGSNMVRIGSAIFD